MKRGDSQIRKRMRIGSAWRGRRPVAVPPGLAAFAGAALVAAIGLALAPLLSAAGQWFIDGGARVNETIDTYVRIRLLGAPFSLINYAVLGYVLGRGEGGLGLLLQIILNGCNIALCILLGLELDAELDHEKALREGVPADVEMFAVPKDTRKFDDEQTAESRTVTRIRREE